MITLYGDGVHDDSDALQALADGDKSVQFNCHVAPNEGSPVHIIKAHFVIRESVYLGRTERSMRLEFTDCTFTFGVGAEIVDLTSGERWGGTGKVVEHPDFPEASPIFDD